MLRASHALAFIAFIALPALGSGALGCAQPTTDVDVSSAAAVSAGEILDGLPRSTWFHQGQGRGSQIADTGIGRWDVYVAFGAKAEPYVLAFGESDETGEPVVEVVVDVEKGELDLRSAVPLTQEARALWLEAIARDLRALTPEGTGGGETSEPASGIETRSGPTPKVSECKIAVGWAVLHAAGFAAAGALTVGACTLAAASSVVTGGLSLAFCIWQASDTVDLAAETTRRIKTARNACSGA